MSDHQRIAPDRDARLENFAAELTRAAYPLVLRNGRKDSWLQMELGLWKALAEQVKKWARTGLPGPSPAEIEAWREGLLADLTESAFATALRNGAQGPLLALELALYRAFRLVVRKRSRVR
jgi:hypothetical protein